MSDAPFQSHPVVGNDWKTVRIGDVFEMQLGKMLSKAAKTGRNSRPYLANRNVQWDRADLSALEMMDFSESEQEKFSLRSGDLLVCEGGEVGRTCIWRGERLDCYFQKAIHRLRSTTTEVLPEYMLRLMRLMSSSGAFTKFTSQSSIAHLTREKLVLVPITVPPIPQQRKIARILTTLDNLIEKTEALIAKYQSIKQGMMADLFTRGVDANGKLRPPQSAAPELYKQSELGWIPKEWEVKTLDSLVSPNRPIAYGILMPGYGHPGGVQVIKVKDIKGEQIIESDLLLTSPEIDHAYRRSRVKQGDLLFTIRGTVGRTAIVPSSLEGANITQDTARIGIISGDARFVKNYLKMHVPSQFILCNTLGVAVQGINLRDVRRIQTAFPTSAEQEHLGNIVETHDSLIDRENTFLRKLAKKKTGLMQDLLTGRVPVKPDESEEAA